MSLLANQDDSSSGENFITAEINITKDEEYKSIKLINKVVFDKKLGDDNLKIEIEPEKGVEKTEDPYFYKFSKEGIYKIKYSFNKKLENTSLMFYECQALTSLNLSNFNTKNVKYMSSMLCGCESLTSLNLSSFITENVTNMQGMFFNCRGLKSLDLTNFNTINVKNMKSMFGQCSSLEYLNLSNFTFEKTEDMESMFGYCNSLKTLVVPNSFVMDDFKKNYMFKGVEELPNITSSNSNTCWLYDCFSCCWRK